MLVFITQPFCINKALRNCNKKNQIKTKQTNKQNKKKNQKQKQITKTKTKTKKKKKKKKRRNNNKNNFSPSSLRRFTTNQTYTSDRIYTFDKTLDMKMYVHLFTNIYELSFLVYCF